IVNYYCNYRMWLHMKMNFDLVLGVMGILGGIFIYFIDSDYKGEAIVLLLLGIVFILISKNKNFN
ncbi:hypothetical protein, partial [Mammaliicoccus sciuri]|uniref:hypothetical protein n=1 Tax=Mammaliicoccus sciuri TaxID=1296 RepID=UPI0037B493BC